MAGSFSGPLQIGAEIVETSIESGIYVLKCSADRGVAWVRAIPAASSSVQDLAVDPAGNVVVGGSFSGWMETDLEHVTAVEADGYALALDSEGRTRWFRAFAGSMGTGSPIDTVRAVAVDTDGSVYLAGTFRGRLGIDELELESEGWDDAFLTSLDPTGSARWATRLGGPGSDEPTEVAIMGDGDVVLTGGFQGNMTVGESLVSSRGGSDGFVARFDSNGASRWVRGYGDWDGDRIYAAAPTASGNVFAGAFARQPVIGGVRLSGHAAVVARLASDGDEAWVSILPSVGITALRTRGDDGYILSGWFSQRLEMAGGVVVAAAGFDGFVAGLTTEGQPSWVEPFTGLGDDNVTDVKVGGDGRIVIAQTMAPRGELFGIPDSADDEHTGLVLQLR